MLKIHLDVPRPVGAGTDAATSLKERAFAVAVRAVIARQPGLGHVGHLTGEHGIAGAAVVAVENDERVVAKSFLVERGDDAANLVVEARDHAGIGAARGVGYVWVTVN